MIKYLSNPKLFSLEQQHSFSFVYLHQYIVFEDVKS